MSDWIQGSWVPTRKKEKEAEKTTDKAVLLEERKTWWTIFSLCPRSQYYRNILITYLLRKINFQNWMIISYFYDWTLLESSIHLQCLAKKLVWVLRTFNAQILWTFLSQVRQFKFAVKTKISLPAAPRIMVSPRFPNITLTSIGEPLGVIYDSGHGICPGAIYQEKIM